MTVRSIIHICWALALTMLAADLMVMAAYPKLEALTRLQHFDYSKCKIIVDHLGNPAIDIHQPHFEAVKTPEGRWCVR